MDKEIHATGRMQEQGGIPGKPEQMTQALPQRATAVLVSTWGSEHGLRAFPTPLTSEQTARPQQTPDFRQNSGQRLVWKEAKEGR